MDYEKDIDWDMIVCCILLVKDIRIFLGLFS